MRSMTRWTSLLVLPLALAACGVPIMSGSQFASGADPSEPLTFAFNQSRDMAAGDPRLQNNQFFEDRLHEAIEWELGLRGIRHVEDSPDILVHHHLTLSDHDMVDQIIDEQGMSRTEVYSFEEANVVVHLVDAETGGNFWVGWAQANVEPALRGPDAMRGWVYDLVERIFANWTVPGRTTD